LNAAGFAELAPADNAARTGDELAIRTLGWHDRNHRPDFGSSVEPYVSFFIKTGLLQQIPYRQGAKPVED